MRVRRAVSLVVTALVVAAATAGITYALWGRGVSVAMPVITAGNLDLQLVGTPQWTETSPGVTHAVPVKSDYTTANHLATPGDTFTVRQQFRTVLSGDNMAARVNVRWAQPVSLTPTGAVTATYVVTRPDGVSSPSRPVGQAVSVPGSPANLTPAQVAAWGGTPWSVTITLAYSGTASNVVAPTAVVQPATSLGAIVLELEQVREGDGFE